MMALGTIVLAGGLFIIASASLLWIHVHQHRPAKRRDNSTRATHQVKSTAGISPTTKTRKPKAANPVPNAKKSTFKPRVLKRKPRPGYQPRRLILPSQEPSEIPPTTSSQHDEKQKVQDHALVKKLSNKSSHPDNHQDNKEKETASTSPRAPTPVSWQPATGTPTKPNPKEEEEDENKKRRKKKAVTEEDDSVTSSSNATVSSTDDENDGNDEEESDGHHGNEANTPAMLSPCAESSTKSKENVTHDSPPQLSSPLASQLPPPTPSRDEDFRGKKRRRRRRRNISKPHNTPPISQNGNTKRASTTLSNPKTGGSTRKTEQDQDRSAVASRPRSSKSKNCIGTRTRPPFKSKPFSYSLDSTLSGSQERLSSLESANKSLFAPADWTTKDSTPHQSGKPRKRPIVPTFRGRSPNNFGRPYVDDTDNDSNVSGQESKTIHDSDSGSRHRTFSEASKRGVSDEELLEDDGRFHVTTALDDDDEDSMDRADSVMSGSVSVSRTTATSLSELDKREENWSELESEEISQQPQRVDLVPVALPNCQEDRSKTTCSSKSAMTGKNGTSEKKRNRRRSRSRNTTDEEKRCKGKSQSRKNQLSERVDVTSPSPEIPQQFGQHLAHLAQNQKAASVNGDAQYQQNQPAMPTVVAHGQPIPWTFPQLNGVGQVPMFVPYPGLVDLNGNPQVGVPAFLPTPMNPLMNHTPGADVLSMSCPDLGTLMRSQSDPTTGVHPTQMLFPTVFAPTTAQPTPPWYPAVPATTAHTPIPVPDGQNPGDAYELSGSMNERESLYAVSTPTGGLSLETSQTLGRSNSSTGTSAVPSLTNNSSGTPSVLGGKPEAIVPTRMIAPSPFVPYTFTAQNGLPMLAQPIYDPAFLAALQTAQLTMPQLMTTPQPVLQTIPNAAQQQHDFRQSVLAAPHYQPTHIPNPDSNDASGIPNPKLEQFSAVSRS